jgi:hypothetical protein
MANDLSAILEASEPMLLATDLEATEGPLWHPAGFLTFVDLQGSRLLRWDAASGVRAVREDTGEGNGCTLDRQGRLIMCEGRHRRITCMDPDGTITTLADRWQGKRLKRCQLGLFRCGCSCPAPRIHPLTHSAALLPTAGLERFATRCRGAIPIFPGGQALPVHMCHTSK